LVSQLPILGKQLCEISNLYFDIKLALWCWM